MLIATVLATCGACTRSREPPNLVFILVDTLRADRLGAYGNSRGLTPFLDGIAARGTVFANAYAPSSWTCPSVASLFTSRYASQHGINNFEAKLGRREATLAESLTARGYACAGFSANFRVAETLGYAQGFDAWEVFVGARTGKPRGDRLRRASIDWLRRSASGSSRPVFLYLQYMEPHTPYEPVAPFRKQFLHPRDDVDLAAAQTKLTRFGWGTKGLSAAEIDVLFSLYDGEVASVDAELRTLFGEIEALGLLDNTVIVLTADHGEEFGEHGELLHGNTLYNTAIRVPLIIAGPGVAEGRVVEREVSLVDLAPTLLDLAGVPPPQTFEGHSLVPLLRPNGDLAALWARLARPSQPSEVLSELEPIGGRDLRRHTRAIVADGQKLLVAPDGTTTVYDLRQDPGETTPQKDAGAAAALLARLDQRREALRRRAVTETERQPLDEATKEKLRALGYPQR